MTPDPLEAAGRPPQCAENQSSDACPVAERIEPRIVHVGGAGRSGTTLLAHQLARIEGIATAGESPWVAELINARLPKTSYVPFVRSHWKVRAAPVQLTDASWRELAHLANNAGIDVFIAHVMQRLTGTSARIIIDHTPTNITFRNTILSAFPNPQFVHIVRDGRAVFASLKKVRWGPSSPYSAAHYWEAFVARGLAAEMQFGDRVHRITYEDLVRNPAALVSAGAFILGEDPIVKTDPQNIPIARHTSRQHELVNAPPKRSRIDSWHAMLSPAEVAAFEYYAGSTLEFFDYSLVGGYPKEPRRARRFLWSTREYFSSTFVNPVRNGFRTRFAHYR